MKVIRTNAELIHIVIDKKTYVLTIEKAEELQTKLNNILKSKGEQQ
jgi:hypothetical protein